MGHSSIAVTEKYLRVDSNNDLKPMIHSYSKIISKGSQKNTNIIDLKEKMATKVATK